MKRLKRDLYLLALYALRTIVRATDALIERSNRRERE
jgi:hypothetical protein